MYQVDSLWLDSLALTYLLPSPSHPLSNWQLLSLETSLVQENGSGARIYSLKFQDLEELSLFLIVIHHSIPCYAQIISQ